MRVWIVTEDEGEYGREYQRICGVFTDPRLADEYVAALKRRPGFVGESPAGDDADYDVHEWPVWDVPVTSQVVAYHVDAAVQRGVAKGQLTRFQALTALSAYRVAHVVREGTEADLWYSRCTPDAREPSWANIEVCAPTDAAALSEARRLALAFQATATGGEARAQV